MAGQELPDLARLRDPFEPADIQWRATRAGKGQKGIWVLCVPYFTRPALINRLTSVCGINGWQTQVRIEGGYIMAGIGIRIGEEWVWRWDGTGASEARDEKFTVADAGKGDFTNALKRAAEQWGIGLDLKEIPEQFGTVYPEKSDSGRFRGTIGKGNERTAFRWDPPLVTGSPSRPGALPGFEKEVDLPANNQPEKPKDEDLVKELQACKDEVKRIFREHHFFVYHLEALAEADAKLPELLKEWGLQDWRHVADIARRKPQRFDEVVKLLAPKYPTGPDRVAFLRKRVKELNGNLSAGEKLLIESAIQVGYAQGVEHWIDELHRKEAAHGT